jgi:hypothetical protein
MADYSVGNLEFSITTIDDNTVKKLNLISKSLGSLQTSLQTLNSIDTSKVNSGLSKLVTSLNKLGKKNLQGVKDLALSLKGLSNLRYLNSVAGLSTTLNGMNFSKVAAGFSSLTTAINPFLTRIEQAKESLIALNGVLASTNGSKLNKTLNGGATSRHIKTLNFAALLGKIYFVVNYSKRLAQFVSKLVQSGIDYTETLNLWQVAMRGNIDTAEEFISKMNKAYGIAEQTLMKYQATFRNMLSTLGGVSTDVSYALSEYLTQMAIDYASLYNTSIEKAMTTFQSVLSGQVRPIHSISGYDITENTIFELYQQLGGTKTMRQLTQTEKRLLRIYAVFQQMDRSGAIGDLNKTLNNTANQMRVMKEAAKELGTWVGKLIEIYLVPLIPKINAILIVAKDVAKAAVKSLPQYKEFDGTIKGYEETADAIEQVKGKLLDFDKFRALSSGEQEENNIGIDSNLVEGLSRYESILANVRNDAAELAKTWKVSSGFFDAEGNFNIEQWERLAETFKSILDFVAGIVAINLVKWLTTAISALPQLFTVTKSLSGLEKTMMGINTAVTAFVLGYTIFSTVLESLSPPVRALVSIIGSFVGALITALGVYMMFKNFSKYGMAGIAVTAAGLGIGLAGITSIANQHKNLISADQYANGGSPQKGTLFVAGEAGAEMVYNTPSGQSGVANVQQIQQAMYGALVAYGRTQGNGATDDRPIDIYIDGEKVFQATKKNAKRHGLAFSKV